MRRNPEAERYIANVDLDAKYRARPLSREELLRAVKTYLQTRYEDGGWDVLVECWDDNGLRREIGKARTARGAIKNLRDLASIYDDRQLDAINSAF